MGWRRSPGEGSLGQGKPVAGSISCWQLLATRRLSVSSTPLPCCGLYWSMLANSRHQWNRLGHCARKHALRSFGVGSFSRTLTSARIDQCDSVYCTVPCPAMFFSGVAPLEYFEAQPRQF
jgi:hypothetical protein